MSSGNDWGIPMWLILFVIAGMLLFALKISSEDRVAEERRAWSGSLRLFLAIAMALFTIFGVVDFVVWVRAA